MGSLQHSPVQRLLADPAEISGSAHAARSCCLVCKPALVKELNSLGTTKQLQQELGFPICLEHQQYLHFSIYKLGHVPRFIFVIAFFFLSNMLLKLLQETLEEKC